MKRPTAEQFYNFQLMIDDELLTEISNKTSQGDVYQNKINNSPVHKWLLNNLNYKGALESLRRRDVYKKSSYQNILEIRLADSAAQSYFLYIDRIENPKSLIVLNSDDINNAKKAVNKLIGYLEKGVSLQNYWETENLWELLKKLQHEIDNDAPQHFPVSKKPLLPEKMLVENLSLITDTAIGEHMPAVIEKLANVIANIDHTQYSRYAKAYREKMNKRIRYICPNVNFEE